MSSPYIGIERIGRAGHLILNRPKALNALNLSMIEHLQEALDDFLADDRVERIIIRSSDPRAFSAGGDMRVIREKVLAGDMESALAFFRAEFALNLAISRSHKPYVSLIEGICMGGGLGLSVHGHHRIIAEGACIAMPETAIGYFTDVGGTYFLNRLPGRTGYWLGLTGAHIDAEDAVAIGIGTHLVRRDKMSDILDALCHDARPVDEILARHHCTPRCSLLQKNADDIYKILKHDNFDKIINSIKENKNEISELFVDHTKIRSPHALQTTLDLLLKGRFCDLETCLSNEYEALPDALRHPDFVEGVRSVLVDKDRNANWHHRLVPGHSDQSQKMTAAEKA